MGLKPQQYQALLAIKAHHGSEPMAATELAGELFIRMPTAVELIDRLAEGGLVVRSRSEVDRRRQFVTLTEKAEALLEALAVVHHEELRQQVPALISLLSRLAEPPRKPG